jgi:sugar/nucleoside kinase (ribokinase family)
VHDHILICGPVSWNTLVYLDHLPEPRPHMQFALEDFQTVGGTSAGKALHLTALGRPIVCHSVLGDDDTSARLRSVLAGAGIEVTGPVTVGAGERHLNLMTPAGERVSLYLSVPAFVAPDTAEFDALSAGADALVMDLSETSRALLPAAVRTGVPIWTDIHDYDGTAEFHQPFIQAADYIFLSADGLSDPLDFMRARVHAGARAVICTLGSRGAMALDADGLHNVPAVPVQIRDTNGAGDAFFAGYLNATLAGVGTLGALTAAAAQAAIALQTKHLHPSLEALLP